MGIILGTATGLGLDRIDTAWTAANNANWLEAPDHWLRVTDSIAGGMHTIDKSRPKASVHGAGTREYADRTSYWSPIQIESPRAFRGTLVTSFPPAWRLDSRQFIWVDERTARIVTRTPGASGRAIEIDLVFDALD